MAENPENNELLAKWLTGEITEEELAQLGDQVELDELRVVTDDIATWTPGSFDVDRGLEKLQARNKEGEKGKVISLRPWVSIAATISLILVGYLGWNYFFNAQVNISTGIAETKEVTLPDGSLIKLDATSEISYNKRDWNENRVVALKGQAFFDVEKAGSFVVNTDVGTVEVLGTQFNINALNEHFKVQCYEGKVAVKAADQEKILAVGQQTELQNGRLTLVTHESTAPDWIAGFTFYQGAPLPDVIDQLKRYYPINIDLPDQYAGLKFSGKVVHNNQSQALRAIFDTMEIQYSLDQKGNVVFD
ncbi:MAG: FecR domain-containing protein [Bacteroidota bacterium]